MAFDATDLLADAPDISASASVFSGIADWDNSAATDDAGEDSVLRYAYGVWHKLFVPVAGTCTFQDMPDAGSTDTYMEVFSGPPGATSPAALTLVESNDDDAGDGKPLVTYVSPGGEWVYIAHTAYNGAQVTGQRMSWSIPAASTSADVSFGDLTATVTVTDRPTAALYDTDGTWLAALPLAAGIQWQEELSAPGALSLRLPLDDPTTALATSHRIFKVTWRGKDRQAAEISSSSTDVAVDGRVWRQWSNLPGILNLFKDVPIYPEYGLDHTSNSSRTFGYMSRYGHGQWLDSGDFTPAIGVAWSAMTGARAGLPEGGLDFPNPMWIAKRGPNADEPAGSYQYFRRMFYTDTPKKVRILATGDNRFDLWLNGEQLVSMDGQGQFTWRELSQITMTLPAAPVGGRHMIAARVRNNRDGAGPNHMGLLFVLEEVDDSGNPLGAGHPPIIISDTDWDVSDIAPGFRKAEVILRLWLEGRLYNYAAVNLISLAFARDADSDGVPWVEDPAEYTLDVGSSMLDALTTFAEKGIDVNVDPRTLKLKLWNRRGNDKTDTVVLRLGRDGGNLIAHDVDEVDPSANAVIMQVRDGRWMQRQNTAAAAAGRRGVALSVGSTSDSQSAYQVADALLAETSLPTLTFTTQISSRIGQQVYVDFDMGDTITVPGKEGSGEWYAGRLMAVTVDASSDGPVQVTPELMWDHSATPLVTDSGGAGTTDPGDLEASSDNGTGTGGGTTDPITPGGTDVAYDWTANPYGTAYAADGTAGGYVPDDTHSGVPAGTTFAETVTAAGGMLTINNAGVPKGIGTASASSDTVTLAGHGLPNGQVVYFSALSSDGAGLTTGVAGWCVVSNATTNTFKLKRANEDTGLFSTVNITADYSSVTVMASNWYDLPDYACYITIAASSTGIVQFTRRNSRGPATASATSASAAQGLIFNLSNAWVIDADSTSIPDAPVAKLDAYYGKNFRIWRPKWKRVIDGIGSHGNNVVYGPYGTAGAWFYPDPQHSDGSHCDLGMQVFGGDKHRMIGPHIEGLVDASASSTSDPTRHPIPATTNTVLQVNHAAGFAAPTNVNWDAVLLGGGAYTINVDGSESRPNLGHVHGRFKRNAHYGAIAAPSPGAKAGVTIHYDTSGCVYDDDNTAVTPYKAPGTNLVWP